MAVDPVRVTRMEVHRGHLVCLVSFAGAPRVTSASLMRRVLPAFPMLPQHACVNERGTTFAAVMDCTPLPHLLEHLVVDLQVRSQIVQHARVGAALRSVAPTASRTDAYAGSAAQAEPAPRERPIVGTSEWADERAGLARIDVSFADDQVALRAFRDAVAFLNETLRGAE